WSGWKAVMVVLLLGGLLSAGLLAQERPGQTGRDKGEREAQPAPGPEERAALVNKAWQLTAEAIKLSQQNKLPEALQKFQQALAVREQLYPKAQYPDGHPDLATSLSNLGGVLNRLGQPVKALPYFERTLAMCEQLYPKAKYPDGHPLLAG